MLYGAGKLLLLSKELNSTSIRGQQLVLPTCIASFELTPDNQQAEAKCLIDGKKVITVAKIVEENWTLKLSFEKAGWNELAFAFDELSQTSSNIAFPIIKYGVVSSANEIVDASVTASMADIRVYRDTPNPAFLKRIPTGTPVAGEFIPAAGKITFPTGSAGQTISYYIPKTYTSIETIGEEANYDTFGRLIFSGNVYTSEESVPMQIVVHELSRIKSPSFNINGGLSALEVEFRAGVPAGKRKAFSLFRVSTGV